MVKVRTLFLAEMNGKDGDVRGSFQARDSSPGVSMHKIENSFSQSEAPDLAFSNIAGVLLNNDRVRFERMLFRATRGNCWIRFGPISEIDALGDVVGTSGKSEKTSERTVFIIFYKSQAIQVKIKKICDAFGARRYDIESLDRPNDLRAQESANARELKDAKFVLEKNIATRKKLCETAALSIEEWFWVARREKSVYFTLNLFKSNSSNSNMLRGSGWMLTSSADQMEKALSRAHAALNLPTSALLEEIPKNQWPTPHTHFKTNDYTDAFQEFVNTYGVPRYKEANPALFTAATFPFLFGIMYGDIGHGCCLLFFGLYLILTNQNSKSRTAGEMVKGVYGARYVFIVCYASL